MRSLKPRLRIIDTRAVKVKPKRAEAFYLSPQWRDFRDRLLRKRGRRCQDPDCRDPTAAGVRYGDHIKERHDGGADFDEENVLIRCAPCHGRKTEAERAARTAAAATPAPPPANQGRGV
jgi:5-methylcytosine-specific restriction protein A